MSVIIIPLAGPDFYTKKFGIRPLYKIRGFPLIEYVLRTRPWYQRILDGKDELIFILREEGLYTNEMLTFISNHFPLANTVVLSCLSAGAPLSALAGIAIAKQRNVPIIVDLADIAFGLDCDPSDYFRKNDTVDALVPYFHSQNPKFSYLSLDGVRLIEAREKQVISSHASAGVYVFRDAPTYLRAVNFCLQHLDLCKVGESFFLCPSVNGLVSKERSVHAIEVCNAEPIGAIFHRALGGSGHEI